jgi:5-(carboxyamino)imidazole ribonucleotide synthase
MSRKTKPDPVGVDRRALPPRSVIGILGSGQLGKMLAQAASRLGFRTHVYADDSGPALDVAGAHSIGSYTSFPRLDEFADVVDVVTYEFENVPVAAAEHLLQRLPVRPGAKALRVAQDRIAEKQFISGLGIPVAPFAIVDGPATLAAAEATFASWDGGAAILKTARMGYDGKGQVGIGAAQNGTPRALAEAFGDLGRVPCVLERRIAFSCEISVLVVRGLDGTVACYDCPLNEHGGGILRRSTVPAGLPLAVDRAAQDLAARIATALDYVGVLGVELFYLGSGAAEPLMVNEIAPRVHNSGHWTMDACAVGQFENHIRAVAGWPLGATARHSDAVMENLIGHEADDWQRLAAEPDACLHLYGKREARDGRKMGHLNRLRPLNRT